MSSQRRPPAGSWRQTGNHTLPVPNSSLRAGARGESYITRCVFLVSWRSLSLPPASGLAPALHTGQKETSHAVCIPGAATNMPSAPPSSRCLQPATMSTHQSCILPILSRDTATSSASPPRILPNTSRYDEAACGITVPLQNPVSPRPTLLHYCRTNKRTLQGLTGHAGWDINTPSEGLLASANVRRRKC